MKKFKFKLSLGLIFAVLISFTLVAFAQPELEELQEEKPAVKKESKEEPKKEAPKSQEEELTPLKEEVKVIEYTKSNVAGIPDDIPINMDDVRPLFKEKWEYIFNASFETVYATILKSIEEYGCQIASKNPPQMDDKGLQKANIKSDDCVFSIGEDSSFKVIRKYALADDKVIEKDGKQIVLGKGIPNIRGGKWLNGRLKYNFKLLEQADGKTSVTLKSEMSAYEDYVVHEVLFFTSNGVLESRLLNVLFKNLRTAKTE